jgi:hypothetical protein
MVPTSGTAVLPRWHRGCVGRCSQLRESDDGSTPILPYGILRSGVFPGLGPVSDPGPLGTTHVPPGGDTGTGAALHGAGVI